MAEVKETNLEIKLFAAAKHIANADCCVISIVLPTTARELMLELAQQSPELKDFAAYCRLAVEHRFVDLEAIIDRQVELALIPPVSGG